MKKSRKVRAWLRKQDKNILISSPDVIRATGLEQKNVSQILQQMADRGEIERAGTKSHSKGKPYILYRILEINDDTLPPAPIKCKQEYMLASDRHEMKMMVIMNGIDAALNWMTCNRQRACNGA